MKTKEIKWQKVVLFLLLTAFLGYMTGSFAITVRYAYNDWVVNRYNVQERVYYALRWLFGSVQLLICSATLLALSIFGLIHSLRPREGKGKAALFFKRRGLILAIAFAVLFALLFLLDRAAWGRIAATVETDEVPAALSDHRLSVWLEIGAELMAEGGIISLVAWIWNRDRKRPEKAEA